MESSFCKREIESLRQLAEALYLNFGDMLFQIGRDEMSGSQDTSNGLPEVTLSRVLKELETWDAVCDQLYTKLIAIRDTLARSKDDTTVNR